MSLVAKITAELDERSADEAANELERRFGETGGKASASFKRDFGSGLEGVREEAERVGRDSGSAFDKGLRGGVGEAISGISNQMGALGNVVDDVAGKGSTAFSGMSTGALAASAGVAAIGVAAVLVGKQLYDIGAQWDSVSDGITLRTGKIGDELKGLTDIVGDVGSTTAASLGDIGNIVGQLSQSMPGLTENGGAIRDLASNLAYLDANGQSVNIREMGQAFTAFGVNAADQVGALDRLAGVSRSTGIPINELISAVRSGAPEFKQFGLDVGAATGLVASFDNAGLDSGVAIQGLRTALGNMASDSRGAAPALADAVTQIKAFIDAGQEGSALQLSEKIFGTENASAFVDAISSGRLNTEALKKALDDAGMSLQDLQDKTGDGAEGFTKLSNSVKSTLGPAADFVFNAINSQLQLATGNTESLITASDRLEDKLRDVGAVAIAPDSALGKMLLPAGGLGGTPGIAVPGGIGSSLTPVPGNGLVGPNGALLPQWGTTPVGAPSTGAAGKAPAPFFDPSQWQVNPGVAASGTGGMTSGSVQYDPTQGGYGSFQVDPDKVASAAERLSEAKLRQLELDQQENVKQSTMVAAKNNVLQAERALADAQQGTWQKMKDTADGFASGMGEIGAALDSDLGISKGLPGLAENLVRFVASLAAAPLLGQLSAVSQANPNQGSGLMGILASQGAFGAQYTPAAIAASSTASATGYSGAPGYGRGVAGAGGAYPGDAALLANVPRGIGEYDNGTKDLSKGLVDCASGVEDLVNIMDGKSTAGGSLWTGNAASVLPGRGFVPGMGGPGDFRIGYNDHHMQATLPGGTNVNYGSTSAIRAGGLDGGAGAFDPSFTDHWYRPAGGAPAAAPAASAGAPDVFSPENTNPGPNSPATPGWGGPTGLPQGLTGGAGEGPIFGAPTGPGIGGSALSGQGMKAPGAPGAPPLNTGVAFPSSPGGGGAGVGGGIMEAAGLAAGAADLIAPGAGAAAQVGMKLLNRTIQYGAQNVGIGVSGLMETFLPFGSEKAAKGWLPKLAGAAASASPALPNMAGGKPPPQAPGGAGGAGGSVDNSQNITNNVQTPQGSTPDQQAKALEFHQGASNSRPGP